MEPPFLFSWFQKQLKEHFLSILCWYFYLSHWKMVLQKQLMLTLLVIIRLKCTFKLYAFPTVVGTVFSLLIICLAEWLFHWSSLWLIETRPHIFFWQPCYMWAPFTWFRQWPHGPTFWPVIKYCLYGGRKYGFYSKLVASVSDVSNTYLIASWYFLSEGWTGFTIKCQILQNCLVH
jgi:hypothetical protein